MKFISGSRVFLALLFSFLTSLASAQKDFPLPFGAHEPLESKIRGEKRDILVSVPAHPVSGMPLLILLDGEWNLRNVSGCCKPFDFERPHSIFPGGRTDTEARG